MRILVIEDNRDILANVLDYLQLKGYSVDCAQDGLGGLHLATTVHYDLIVLDIMLPGVDGYQVCKRLREDARSEVPILMLTARDALEDRLTGLRAGADDYLVKPFALSELVARIEAILRRSSGGKKRQLKVADLVYDLDTLDITRADQPLKLNPLTMKLLAILMQKSPEVVSREEIEDEIWGFQRVAGDNLRAHIYQIRKIVDKPFEEPLIETRHGFGWAVRAKEDLEE